MVGVVRVAVCCGCWCVVRLLVCGFGLFCWVWLCAVFGFGVGSWGVVCRLVTVWVGIVVLGFGVCCLCGGLGCWLVYVCVWWLILLDAGVVLGLFIVDCCVDLGL